MNLIQYVASYGDLHGPNKAEMKPGVPQRKPKVQARQYTIPLMSLSESSGSGKVTRGLCVKPFYCLLFVLDLNQHNTFLDF